MIKYGKIYYKRPDFALDINELSIKNHEKVAILGENGCGKSTFINYSCGLLDSEINVSYMDRPLKTLNTEERANIFALFSQNPDVAFPFTVFEVVRMGRFRMCGGNYSRKDDEKTIEKLTLFDIVRYKDKRLDELSGGEKRRVLLARAFNQETPYLFLDEPVSMLDIRHSLEIMNIIEDTMKTVIASMHDVNLAIRYFKRLIFMKDGRILYDVSNKEVTPQIIEEVYNVKVSPYNNAYSFVI
ncbi:ABC transporter ATP-binding protein [Seleniivibrio woodruffii]|uniref:Iron complex transport system ATP-binding protein n=1 Tax=Seleniivibrio woodruffii TaxID=1078050 RepID=A0A4R1KA33_9BACT|nr:ABC transporter ATP-binding protein [Seleniivibrio woodruffii]TCK60753.1 iron complex transport system ATP-binding protein [Seleniivibrio woodruffii]TVZ36383.1 iron complex transport system ATP-binding protein [Seleniivibrio woodruffii]